MYLAIPLRLHKLNYATRSLGPCKQGVVQHGHYVFSCFTSQAQILDDVDHHIFRTVMWDQDIVKFGLAIKNVSDLTYCCHPLGNPLIKRLSSDWFQITVYESMREGPRYNMMGTGGTAGQMLRLFSHHDWSDFCLAHLFAFQQFVDGRVGVAYPASSEDHPGGICSRGMYLARATNHWNIHILQPGITSMEGVSPLPMSACHPYMGRGDATSSLLKHVSLWHMKLVQY